MQPALARVLALSVPLAMLSGQAVARAEDREPVEPVELLYSSSAGCPSEAAFRSGLSLRTNRLRERPGVDEAFRIFRLDLRYGHPSRGWLTIEDRGGRTTVRAVESETCGDVAAVLALAVALAVDPQAERMAATTAASSAPTPGPPATLPPPPPAPLPSASETTLIEPPKDIAPSASWPKNINVRMAGEATAMVGLVPGVLSAYGGWLEVTRRSIALELGLRLGLRYGATTEPSVGGPVVFRALLANADACPFRLGSDVLSVEPCIRVSVGNVNAQAISLVGAPTPHTLWLSGGVSAAFRWRWRLFFVGPTVSAYGVMTHKTYEFQPSTPVYSSPVVAADMSLSAGLQLP